MKDKIHEHILVCLSSSPSNGNLIRTASKMHQAFGGSLTALYVQTKTASQMGNEDRTRLQSHTRLAESLGATISTVSGEDVAYQIAEFSRLSEVTKIVIGRSPSRGLLPQKPLTEKLIELAPQLDIYIIPDTTGGNKSGRNPAGSRPGIPTLNALGTTLAILLLSSAIGFLFHSLRFTEANIITIYILGVLLTALFTRNYLCSGISSLASVLLFNFFFTQPQLSFRAYESGYPVTFAIMLAAALITGTLANRLADHAKQSSQAAWRTQALLDTTQQLQRATDEDEILSLLAAQLLKLVNRPVRVLGSQGQAITMFPQGQTREFPVEGLQYYAIPKAFGQVLLPGPALDPFESSILLSILGEGALAMESRRNARQKEAAAVLAKNEQLRANLLRSISHDLRTPLTSISGNAENLLVNRQTMDAATQEITLRDIYDDAIWLNQLVENLLAITKIGEGHTRLNLSCELVEDVIGESLRHIRHPGHGHILETDIPDEPLLAQMDARLISQVIINLVDNAIKYTPSGSIVAIRARRQGDQVAIQVADNGPGIPDDQKAKVFDMFYTGDTQVADCRRSMGLGLSLCKSIVTIHGGEISLQDNHPTGCVFTFTLPASEVIINE